MKLNKSELKKIIKEEIQSLNTLNEENASEWTIMYKGLLSGFRKSKFKNLENVAKAVGFLIKTEYGSGAKNDFIKAIKRSIK